MQNCNRQQGRQRNDVNNVCIGQEDGGESIVAEKNGHGECSVNTDVGQVIESTAVIERNGGIEVANVAV